MLPVLSSHALARWLPQLGAALLWAAVAATAVLWGLHLPRPADDGPASVVPVAATTQDSGAVARALGHAGVAPATPELGRRFELRGVIAADSGQGSALIAVDGQPPRAFVRGQTVTEGWRLQALGVRSARLSSSPAGADIELQLPSRP